MHYKVKGSCIRRSSSSPAPNARVDKAAGAEKRKIRENRENRRAKCRRGAGGGVTLWRSKGL